MKTRLNLTEVMQKLKVLAVTKGRSVLEIETLYNKLSICRMGENRLKEAASKIPQLPSDIEWHFIGKLQSRKIHKIVGLFDVIQSIETLEQAIKISECNKKIDIFLQVNISRRATRSGVMPEKVPKLISQIQKLPNIRLIGVMGMASPINEVGEEQVLHEFKLLKSLQAELSECSMGMSGDWPLAIEAGATMLRLGRCLFDS